MTKDDWQQVKDIFAEALEQPADLRLDFVRARCDGNQHLLIEISSLLNASDEPDNLIEDNALDFNSTLAAESTNYTDKHFGNYRIIREIGSGGMGTVFLAERDDGEFTQQVALKIVRQSIADSAIIERFRRERQILANLNHPNIAALHDGGVNAEGEPFLAMEYVDGETLTDYVEKHRLSIRERLRLFLKICNAVSYAHRNLVVHRDIKPSNILVTTDGEPKLLDFGLAKAFESDAAKTQTALRAFTPAYASPEQIQGGNITTASDVYSLGVVFYELLTGAKPLNFDNKSFEEIVRTIESSEPAKPSDAATWRRGDAATKKEEETGRKREGENIVAPTPISASPTLHVTASQLKGDLDNIALTAIRKEPERRYSSVEDFAKDIESNLAGRPITARPNTLSYLAAKFVKRNKLAVAAASVVLIAILVGLFVSLWQAQIARQQRDRAERRFNDVRTLSNSLLFEITPNIENLNGSTKAREILVKRALEYLDSLATESQSDSQLQGELASAYEKIGELQANPNKPSLNDALGSIESYQKAQKIRLNLPETPENQMNLAQNLRNYSDVIFSQNDVKGSLQASADALKIYEQMRSTNPESADLQIAYSEAQIEYGSTYSSNNQYGEAIPIFQKAIDDLAGQDQNNQEIQKISALAFAQLGNALSWNDKQPEAEIEMSKAVKIIGDLAEKNPNDSIIRRDALKILSIASGIYEQVKNDVSLEFAEKALQVAISAVEADAADAQAKSNLARAYSRVGICLVNVKQIASAISNLQKSEKLLGELAAQEPKNISYQRGLALFYVRFGDAQTLENKYPEAAKSYQQSADIFESLALMDEKNTLARRDGAQSLKNVGDVQLKMNQKVEAKQTFQKALEILTNLKIQNALGESDQKMIDEVQVKLEKLSKM